MAVTRFSAYGGPYSDNSFAGKTASVSSTVRENKLWIGLSTSFLLQVMLFVKAR